MHYNGSKASFVQASDRVCEAEASQSGFSAWIVISRYIVDVFSPFLPFKVISAVYDVDRVHENKDIPLSWLALSFLSARP